MSTLIYTPTAPADVTDVPRMRLYAAASRTDPPAADLTPGLLLTDGSWSFTLPGGLADGVYYLSTTVHYRDGQIVEDTDDTVELPVVDSGLVTVERYRQLTGDTTGARADIAGALRDGQQLVEAYLGRPLEQAQRTERLRVKGGRVYPSATPLVATTAGTIEGAAIVTGAGWDWSTTPPYGEVWTTVTYTGGWTSATLPLTIAEEIARLAQARLNLTASFVGGAVNVEGDADLGTPPVVPVLVGSGAGVPDRVRLRPWRRLRVG